MNEDHIERRQLDMGDYDLPEEISIGVFSNLAVVQQSGPGGTVEEITIDFLYTGRGMERPKVVSRVIMTPGHALRLYRTLKTNLSKIKGIRLDDPNQPGGPPGTRLA